ncbi:MAG: MraY family glycosyltransferase [Candidatus Omnitrophota bacterium]
MVFAFFIALLASFFLNSFFTPLGRKMGILKAHRADGVSGISKLGGLGIASSFFIAVVFAFFKLGIFDQTLAFVLLACALTFSLGLTDDLLDLSPLKKLFFQFLIAVFLVAVGVKTHIYFLPGFVNSILSILWFVAIMNAFNFLDILDGLASGISILCGATFLYISYATGNIAVGVLAAALLGSNLSFLRFNFFPAKLYMGDMGSLFNGICFAVMAVLTSYASVGNELALFAPLLILALPLYDLFFVIVMRLAGRKPIIKKSRDHFVLRLLDKGVSVPGVVFKMYFFNTIFNLTAVLLLLSAIYA